MIFFKSKQTNNSNPGVVVTIDELMRENSRTKKLKINLNKARSSFLGSKKSALRGRGMEYLESRPYVSQDEIRHIDWKVSARLSHTFTKIYIEEKDRPTYIVVDERSNMFFGSKNCFKSVLAAKIAANLAFRVINSSDKLGGFIITDEKEIEFKPSSSQKLLANFLGTLSKSTLEALDLNKTKQSDIKCWDSIFERIYLKTHPGCLVIIISDFFDFHENIKQILFKIRKKADILAIKISDPLEKSLPNIGTVGFSFDNKEIIFNASDKKLQSEYSNYLSEKEKQLKKLFRVLKIFYQEISTENLANYSKIVESSIK